MLSYTIWPLNSLGNTFPEAQAANIARLLHDSIRRQLKAGATEPVFIASEALKDLERVRY